MISVECPECGKRLKAKPEHAGRRTGCPGCKAIIEVPVQTGTLISESKPDIALHERTESVPHERPTIANPVQRVEGLTGISPDYSIDLLDWYNVSKSHFPPIIGPSIGFLFLFMPIYFVIALLHFVVIGFFLDPIIIPALVMGLHLVCQLQLKGRPWTFASFFGGFQWVWPLAARALLLGLLPAVFLVIPTVIFMISSIIINRYHGPHPIIFGLYMTLMMISGGAMMYLGLRLTFFSHFLIIDRNCGPIEAMKGSWILSRGHFWGLLGSMMLILFITYLVTFVTLGLGMLIVLPRAVMMLNAGYLRIAGSEPIAGVEPIQSPVEPRRTFNYGWIPASGYVAFAMLVGLYFCVSRYQTEAKINEYMETRKNYYAQDKADAEARNKREYEYARKQEERETSDLVDSIRFGSYWITSADFGPGDPAATPTPSEPPRGSPAGGFTRPKVKLLVLGPKKMFIKDLRVPGSPIPGSVEYRMDNLKYSSNRWNEFCRKYGDAIARGEAGAVLVEVEYPNSGGPPGPGGGGPVSPIPTPGGVPSGPEGYSNTGLPVGTPVPLEQARLLTREQFMDAAGFHNYRP